jgi:uncharacterized protein DUF6687
MRRAFAVISNDRSEMDFGPQPLAFVDTTGAGELRPGTDIDLSHWYPNETAARYRADTSTEIALDFAQQHPDHGYLVIGDHADTDGVLSLFALAEPDLALAHRSLLVQAAELGDFSFWGDEAARNFYCALSEERARLRDVDGLAGQSLFEACFDVITALLRGGAALGPASAAFNASRQLINSAVTREVVGAHFASYVVPRPYADEHLAAARMQPRFDVCPGPEVWLSHRVRNDLDRERFQLVSVELDGGWDHTVWCPQYLPWDTETLWRPAGLTYTGERLTWSLTLEGLEGALDALRGKDAPAVEWRTALRIAPWSPNFPVILDVSQPSQLEPAFVAEALADLFC